MPLGAWISHQRSWIVIDTDHLYNCHGQRSISTLRNALLVVDPTPSEISNSRFGSPEKPDFDLLLQRKAASGLIELFSWDSLSRRESAKLRLNAANFSLVIDRL